MTDRRLPSVLTVLASAALVLALAWPASSQEGRSPREEALPERTVVVDVDSPERALYRIAVPNLLGEGDMGPQGAEVLRNDFRLVSLFEVLDARSFVANLGEEGLGIAPGAWSAV